ncbi:MAG: hypothetical protein HY698_03590 [Deltaproteobacteria bacterium]|nr:hypothetical protein [Deltaproteobacteria bacterium]
MRHLSSILAFFLVGISGLVAAASPLRKPCGRVVAHASGGDGAKASLVDQVQSSIVARLRAEGCRPVDVAALQAEHEDVASVLAHADQRLRQAEALLRLLHVSAANKALLEATEGYEQHLLALAERDGGLERLQAACRFGAIARYLENDEEGARATLSRCFVLAPDLDFDPAKFPPAMRAAVTESRLLFDELGTGSLEISAAEEPVTVLINSREVGRAPVRVDEVGPGPNYVTFLSDGRPPVTVSVLVRGAGHVEQVTPRLDVFRHGPLGLLVQASALAGTRAMGEPVREVFQATGEPQFLLLVQVHDGMAGEAPVRGFLYDRTGRLVAEKEGAVPISALSREVGLLVGSLVAPALSLGATLESETGWRAHMSKIARHRLFWPTVGAAALVTTGVLLGVTGRGLSDGQRVVVLGMVF